MAKRHAAAHCWLSRITIGERIVFLIETKIGAVLTFGCTFATDIDTILIFFVRHRLLNCLGGKDGKEGVNYGGLN